MILTWFARLRSSTCAPAIVTAGLAAFTILLVPARSEACTPDPCWGSGRFRGFTLAHAIVAPDGVLVFSVNRDQSSAIDDADALAFVTVDVSDAAGPLEGALEHVAPNLAVWRPTTSLPPSSTLTGTIVVDNEGLAPGFKSCKAFDLPPFTITVTEERLGDLGPIVSEFSSASRFVPDASYADFVCCDGAYPADVEQPCSVDERIPQWFDGYCTSRRGTGYVDASFAFIPPGDAALAANTIVRLVIDGEPLLPVHGMERITLQHSLPRPFEARLEAVNLVTGEVVQGPIEQLDVGSELEGLGPIDHDVRRDLAAHCESPAYVCAAIDDGIGGLRWDPDDCEPFTAVGEDDESTTGTGDEGPDPTTVASSDGKDDDGSGDDGSGSETTAAGRDVLDRGCACHAGSARPGTSGALALGLFVLAAWRPRPRASRRHRQAEHHARR